MIVTDFKWARKDGTPVIGYYMNIYLAMNLQGIPGFLDKSFDCVGIISGRGLVRIGKSTMAQQVGYYLAWLMAGGKMIIEMENNKPRLKGFVKPKREVHFGLENIVFSPQQLMAVAEKLPRNSVIIYDEGRAGLESARAMEQINKGMQDFFQECGQYGHIILIVLPNFFKLHEDYAVARSLFLIDVYADEKMRRGYFSFFNTLRKEQLYYFGKKRIGVTAKYMVTKPNFWGNFTAFVPIDDELYNEAKRKALREKRISTVQARLGVQRDVSIWLLHRMFGYTKEQIQDIYSQMFQVPFSEHIINLAFENIEKHIQDLTVRRKWKELVIPKPKDFGKRALYAQDG